MWRAWPIPSAKTVAQKPAGRPNPLSLLGHAWLLVSAAAAELNRPRASKSELPRKIAASATKIANIVLNRFDDCIRHLPTLDETGRHSVSQKMPKSDPEEFNSPRRRQPSTKFS